MLQGVKQGRKRLRKQMPGNGEPVVEEKQAKQDEIDDSGDKTQVIIKESTRLQLKQFANRGKRNTKGNVQNVTQVDQSAIIKAGFPDRQSYDRENAMGIAPRVKNNVAPLEFKSNPMLIMNNDTL